MISKWLLGCVILTGGMLGCGHTKIPIQSAASSARPGTQWLAWTVQERTNFVRAYVDGYLAGMEAACLSTDELFETADAHVPGHDGMPSNYPSSRCRSSVDRYSRDSTDLPSMYATILTTFYADNPKYLGIPYGYLMEYLKDHDNRDAKDLKMMADKGELRTVFY